MRYILATIIILGLAGLAFAATVTPSVKAANRATKSGDYRTTSWHMADIVVTNARNDTVVFARSDANPWFDQTSAQSLIGSFQTNNSGADSGDVIIKLEIGSDSASYHVPLVDTTGYRAVIVNADTTASGLPTLTSYYKSFNHTLNDSTMTYTMYTVQPKAASGGYKIALPLSQKWPAGHVFTRYRLIFSKGAKFKSGDTTWVKNAFIMSTDYIK